MLIALKRYSLIALSMLLLLTACGRHTTERRDPRLTEPCQYTAFPDPVNEVTLASTLAEQWLLVYECNQRIDKLK